MNLTMGELIDRLCTTSQKIWHREEIKHTSLDDPEVARVSREIAHLNIQRHTLIQELDTYLQSSLKDPSFHKPFPQFKNYGGVK